MSKDYNKILFGKNLELDFPEIVVKHGSEIPMELNHHIKNILSTLREAIEKLKISLILPKILENPKVLQQHLQHTQHDEGRQLVKEYRKRSQQDQTQPIPDPHDKETLKIIDYFQENHQILNVLPNWLDDIDNEEKYFLNALTDVWEIANERFQRSAILELAREKRLHVVYLANEEIVENIKKIKQQVEQKKINSLWQHAAKSGVIQKLEEELAFAQYDNHLIAKRELSKSQREMQRASNVFAAKQQELEENLKKAHSNYEAKLKMDLSEERNIQDEKNKIQLQLQALIKKYDQTIYDKHVEELQVQQEFNKQQQEFKEFLKGYKKEEEIYEELILKQRRLQEAKVLLFAYTGATIKIQKWWKALQKRMAKERAQKDKKFEAAKKQKSVKQAKKADNRGKK